MTAIEIRPLVPSDMAAARHMLARAFDDDPPSLWLFPGPMRRVIALRSFMGGAATDTIPFGHAWAAVEDGRVLGTACWLPPGAYPPSPRRQLRQSVGIAYISPLFPQSLRKGTALLRVMQRQHRKDPHYYLVILAVDPTRQGRGVGSRLIEYGLAAADKEGLPCYLETAKEDNLAFYGRHGFEVGEELRVAGSPPLWTMSREPKTRPI